MLTEFRKTYIRQLTDAVAALSETEMPELTEEKFALFETVGNRLEYEHDYFTRRKFLTVFGCAALWRLSRTAATGCDMSGKKNSDDEVNMYESEEIRQRTCINKLAKVIESICDEECWALPAHVNRKDDPDWCLTVDLFAAETAQALAELYTGLKGVLPDSLRSRMRAEIMRRVIEPFAAKEPYAWWERSDMNWNSVCNGSIGMAALDLLDDEPELQVRLVRRVQENLRFFLEGFAGDGACLEGLGYFTYGFYYYMGFMDLLERKPVIKATLPEKCRKIAEFQQKCYFPSGLSVSFSDGSKHEKYRIGLTCKLAGLYDTVEIPKVSSAADYDFDPCYRFLMASRDLMWSEEYLLHMNDRNAARAEKVSSVRSATDGTERYRAYCLPSAQWAICHGASGGGIAVKGGHNAEPHNHNDVGSFIYAPGDQPLLTDLGAGEYTAQYFKDETRYGYICCSSLGHNVPVINGRGQQAGRNYACDSFCADGETVTLSFAGAYGEPALRSLIRKMKYEPDAERLTVEDVFDSGGCLIEENLVTQGNVKIENGSVIVSSMSVIGDHNSGEIKKEADEKCGKECVSEEGKIYTCRITPENGFSDLKITEEPFMNHEGRPETVKRIIWKVAEGGQTGKIVCRFTIEPVN